MYWPGSEDIEVSNGMAAPEIQILWIKSDYVDPPDTGGKIRTYNLLRQLKKRCRVWYVSLQGDGAPRTGDSTDFASRVDTFARAEERKSGLRFIMRVLAAMFSTKPYIVQKYYSSEIRNCQRRITTSSGEALSSDQSVLICDFLEMTGNVDWQLQCPKILFEHNVESVIWRRYFENERNVLKRAYFWFEHRRMELYERRICNRFDLVLVVSPQDKQILQRLGVTSPIEVIDTGVDTEYFAPQAARQPVSGRLLFLGSLDWMPNIDGINWFVREVYPLVQQSCPHVSLDIVGRRPIAAIESLPRIDDTINVYGSVPDVRPYLANADVFVVPLRIGSGTRLKIFEAMSMQRPVVSTTIGAEGLPIEDEHNLLLGDSPEEFASAVISLLEAPDRKRSMASAGCELVTQNYSWSTVSAKLHDACVRLRRPDHAKVRQA